MGVSVSTCYCNICLWWLSLEFVETKVTADCCTRCRGSVCRCWNHILTWGPLSVKNCHYIRGGKRPQNDFLNKAPWNNKPTRKQMVTILREDGNILLLDHPIQKSIVSVFNLKWNHIQIFLHWIEMLNYLGLICINSFVTWFLKFSFIKIAVLYLILAWTVLYCYFDLNINESILQFSCIHNLHQTNKAQSVKRYCLAFNTWKCLCTYENI